jgi:DNA-binding NtrC family response regulator
MAACCICTSKRRRVCWCTLSNSDKLAAVIDDDVDITVIFRDSLKSIGVTVFTFTDPVAALEHFEVNKQNYYLIISDLKMPGIDGLELLKKVKENNPLVRTLLMTAFEIDDKVFKEYMKKKIIDGFIQKPVKLAALSKLVKQQIDLYNSSTK